MLLQFIDQHFFSAMEVGELSGVNANDSHMNFACAKNHFTNDIGIQWQWELEYVMPTKFL